MIKEDRKIKILILHHNNIKHFLLLYYTCPFINKVILWRTSKLEDNIYIFHD